MNFKYNYMHIVKLETMARRLPDDIDIVDYWYNFFKSKIKEEIDNPELNTTTSYSHTRWRTDFEKIYTPVKGKGYKDYERGFLAQFSQYLILEFQTPGKAIAEHYGKKIFEWIIESESSLHTIGTNLFMQYVAEEWGFPPNVSQFARIVNC
ncbi:MAG: hypothetical protein FWF80_00965 [Defluviitaleaceae bacterium]|nr:hypothetical protein [Defluviitaleaceae bacterium]